MAETLRERVQRERDVSRGWSYDRAGSAGHIHGETWRKWERGETAELSPKLRLAIARAFEWPADWPDHPTPSIYADRKVTGDLAEEVAEILSVVLELREGQAAFAQFAETMGRLVEDLSRTVGRPLVVDIPDPGVE